MYSAFRNYTNLLPLVNFREPSWLTRKRIMSVLLSGYWSESSGKLCIVGTGRIQYKRTSPKLKVVIKLNYLQNSNIYNSLINGTLESLDATNAYYFKPIWILALSELELSIYLD